MLSTNLYDQEQSWDLQIMQLNNYGKQHSKRSDQIHRHLPCSCHYRLDSVRKPHCLEKPIIQYDYYICSSCNFGYSAREKQDKGQRNMSLTRYRNIWIFPRNTDLLQVAILQLPLLTINSVNIELLLRRTNDI